MIGWMTSLELGGVRVLWPQLKWILIGFGMGKEQLEFSQRKADKVQKAGSFDDFVHDLLL